MSTPLFADRILALPLFMGFSRLDFLDIVEQCAFELRTYRAGDVIERAGESCQSLVLTLSGTAVATEEGPAHNYTLDEHLPAPFMLEPERLFGLHTLRRRTLTAFDDVSTLRIGKRDVRKLLLERPAFQINFFNTLSSLAQDRHTLLWFTQGGSLHEQFLLFLTQRMLLPRGEKHIHGRLADLADELGCTRPALSAYLASLRDKGLCLTKRELIILPEFTKLLHAHL